MSGNLPLKGVLFVHDLLSLIIAPLFVGLVLTLVDHWLDD
ncbi:type I toxin-antitoxin system Fst family toxin [Enterococcus alishanensis]